MGLGTTAEYDELLARGYPHLRRLITPHPHEADPKKWAIKALDEIDPKTYFVDWPAEVARRWVRAYADARISEDASGYPGIDNGAPIDEREGRALIAKMLVPEHYDGYAFRARHGLFLVEAMIGADAVIDEVLRGFEAAEVGELDTKYSTRTEFAYSIGFAIRGRASPAMRGQAEDRVRALLEKHPATPKCYVRDFLSYLVGGRAALEASGRKLGLYCVHFCDDPALIREVGGTLLTQWDVQHVVLAGDGMLDLVQAARLREIWKDHQRWVIEQLGKLASPKAEKALKEFGKTNALAKYVEAALAERGGGGTKKTATKKTATKKTATKKTATKKTATKKTATKKTATKKKR